MSSPSRKRKVATASPGKQASPAKGGTKRACKAPAAAPADPAIAVHSTEEVKHAGGVEYEVQRQSYVWPETRAALPEHIPKDVKKQTVGQAETGTVIDDVVWDLEDPMGTFANISFGVQPPPADEVSIWPADLNPTFAPSTAPVARVRLHADRGSGQGSNRGGRSSERCSVCLGGTIQPCSHPSGILPSRHGSAYPFSGPVLAAMRREPTLASEQPFKGLLPFYAHWFKLDAIHEHETTAMPELFNPKHFKKGRQMYMESRNMIVNTYRMQPGQYLSLAACRVMIGGDARVVVRIYVFLNQWGIINFECDKGALSVPRRVSNATASQYPITTDTPYAGFTDTGVPRLPRPCSDHPTAPGSGLIIQRPVRFVAPSIARPAKPETSSSAVESKAAESESAVKTETESKMEPQETSMEVAEEENEVMKMDEATMDSPDDADMTPKEQQPKAFVPVKGDSNNASIDLSAASGAPVSDELLSLVLPTLYDGEAPRTSVRYPNNYALRRYAIESDAPVPVQPMVIDPLVSGAARRKIVKEAMKKEECCTICERHCPQLRYASRHVPFYRLCPECYASGRYPSIASLYDFRREELEDEDDGSEEEWTPEKRIMLLEAVAEFGVDWEQVAAHVGRRPEDCILRVLQEKLLDDFDGLFNNALGLTGPNLTSGPVFSQETVDAFVNRSRKGGDASATQDEESQLKDARLKEFVKRMFPSNIPFHEAGNPVLAIIAFLASTFSAQLAAAFARGALDEICKQEHASKLKARSETLARWTEYRPQSVVRAAVAKGKADEEQVAAKAMEYEQQQKEAKTAISNDADANDPTIRPVVTTKYGTGKLMRVLRTDPASESKKKQGQAAATVGAAASSSESTPPKLDNSEAIVEVKLPWATVFLPPGQVDIKVESGVSIGDIPVEKFIVAGMLEAARVADSIAALETYQTQVLTSQLIAIQLQKIKLKLSHFQTVEHWLEEQRELNSNAFEDLFKKRMNIAALAGHVQKYDFAPVPTLEELDLAPRADLSHTQLQLQPPQAKGEQ